MRLSSPAPEIRWTLQGIAGSIVAAVEAHHKEAGDRLRALRKAKGWNQMDAAHELGVDIGTYGAWERGQHWAYEHNWRKIGEVFEIDPNTIKGPPPAPLGLGVESSDQLQRIEQKVDQIISALAGDDRQAQLAAEVERLYLEAQKKARRPRKAPRQPSPKSAAKPTRGAAAQGTP